MKEEIIRVKEKLKESPLRKLNSDINGRNQFFKEELERINEIDSIIDTAVNNLSCPLKVVLMGEVKAGKSTLLNALSGRVISYMNVVEATATILEVTYGAEESIHIVRNDNSKEKISSIEELNSLLDEKREEQSYFETIAKITVQAPIDRLKEITIVDTPGLNTVTEENANRTEEYILNSDVIVWVLNGNHLGQSDVADKINEVMDLGKPIICAINRIDEINGDIFELEEYVRDEMGYMFEEIFPISSKQALHGILNNDEDELLQSRFNLFNSYLLNNIERNSKGTQEDSVIKSISIQLAREAKVNEFTLTKLQKIKKGIEEEVKAIKINNNRIKSSIEDRLEKWLAYDFLSYEKKSILSSENPKKEIEMFFNEKHISSVINDEYESLSKRIYKSWSEFGDDLIKQKKENLKNTISLDSINDGITGSNNNSPQIIMEESKTGLITGSAVAAGLAGYAAWIGPGAAYVTIGNAIGAFFPPLLIAGLVGGLALGFMKAGKDNNMKKVAFISSIDKAIEDIRRSVKKDGIETILKCLYSISDKYEYDFTKESEALLTKFDLSVYEINEIIVQLEEYTESINNFIKQESVE